MVYFYTSNQQKNFYIIKFEVFVQTKYEVIVMNSLDLRDVCSINITENESRDKLKLISVFHKILSRLNYKSTFLYKKLNLVFSHINNEKNKKVYKNLFERSLTENIEETIFKPFLYEKCEYFKSYVKKILKYNGKFIIITFAEDYHRKNLFIFLYIPSSQRRFIVKFRISALEETLPELYFDISKITKIFMKNSQKRVRFTFKSTKEIEPSINNKQEQLARLEQTALRQQNSSSKPKINYLLWLQLAQLTFETNVWYLHFADLRGVAKEYISMKIINQENILIVIYLDMYMNQLDIFKPYYKINSWDLTNFSLEINISKVIHFFKQISFVNLEKVARSKLYTFESFKIFINGWILNQISWSFEDLIFERIQEKKMKYKETSFNDFKKIKARDQVKGIVLRNSIHKLQKHEPSRTSFKINQQLIKNDNKILKRETIYSTVYSREPKRIFTIFLEVMSKLKSI
jgi:hypothetical protein